MGTSLKSAKGKHFVQRAKKNLNHSFSKRFLQPTYCYAAFGCLSITCSRDTFTSFLLPAAHPSGQAIAEEISAKLTSQVKLDDPLSEAHAELANTALVRSPPPKKIARLEKDVQEDGVGRYEIAFVYAGLGRKQEAFKWLEEAYRAHDVGLVYLKVNPCLDPLRADPRFNDLMLRVGLHN